MRTTRIARPRYRVALHLEGLEERLVLSAAQPTAYEQEFLERLNDARANPAAYGASIGIDLSNVAPSPPLAMNLSLVAAARGHSQDMNDRNYFGHYDLNGNDPGVRLTNAGFPWLTFGESIAAGFANPDAALKALITERGEPDLGHRLQLLAMQPIYQIQNQVGVGIVLNGSGLYQDYYTIDTGVTSDSRPFITGVVYNDANHNGLYDIGEGLPGVTITVAGLGSYTDFNSGGYSIPVTPGGLYQVTISGGGLPTPITKTVSVSTTNVRLNFDASAEFAPAPAPAPAPSPQAIWVAQVGQDLLHRALQPSEIAAYVAALQAGESKDALVASLLQTPDYVQVDQTRWVQDMATILLNRAPTAAEASSWVKSLNQGMTRDTLVFNVFNGLHGQLSDADWVSELNRELFGRPITSSELSSWLTYLKKGARKSIVKALMDSTTYKTVDSTRWLQEISHDTLKRNLTSTEVKYWVNFLISGGTRTAIVAALVESAEFQRLLPSH